MRDSKGFHEEEEKGSPSKNRAEVKFVSDNDDDEEFKDDAKVTSNQQGFISCFQRVFLRGTFQN